jgi:hypothetical protein
MNIKSSFFYAALAACLGTGYGGGVVMSRGDVERARMVVPESMQCEETEADKEFRKTRPMNSRGMGF